MRLAKFSGRTSQFFWKSKSKSHILLKKYAIPLKAPETSYKYTKTTILLAAHKKQQLL